LAYTENQLFSFPNIQEEVSITSIIPGFGALAILLTVIGTSEVL